MATIAADSPMGLALQERVLPKLMELGWSQGEQDDTLAEYIVLMLANGLNEQSMATELSTDLLNAEPDDPAPAEFAKWLFEQIRELQHAESSSAPSQAPAGPAAATVEASEAQADAPVTGDAEMGEGTDASGVIPTGPKAMRSGPKASGRDKRMMGNLNKTLERSSDSALHRVRGTAGTGRINSHGPRDPPKGPRQTNVARNIQAAAGRGMPIAPMGPGASIGQMQYGQPNGGGQVVMDANQMQQMMHMMERQAQMLAQMNNNMQQPFGANGHSRPLNERVGRGGRYQHGGRRHEHQAKKEGDTEMGEDGQAAENEALTEGGEKKDVKEVMCRYNKNCTNPDCPFAHAGPMTYTGINMDTTAECAHGAACVNARCTSRHPSPAKKAAFQAAQPCKYGPLCTKPGCPFYHQPNNGPCKNGADCKVEGCQFWHNQVMCKFPQCTNRQCPYKHAEGQKRGLYRNNTLVLDANGNKIEPPTPAHVSERSFVVDAGGEEELITAGADSSQLQEMDVIT